MLENTRTWSQRESKLRKELQGKTLLGQVGLSDEDLELLGEEIGEILKTKAEKEAIAFLKGNAPLSTAAFLVWCGIRHYKRGNYWDGAFGLLGIRSKDTITSQKARLVLCEVFRSTLDEYGLDSFSKLAEKGHRYVTPILAHGGIPDYCLRDFFEHLVIPLAQGGISEEEDELEAVINQFLGEYRSSFTDVPVRNFLRSGGVIARDLVRRCVKMAIQYLEGGKLPDHESLHLPPAIVKAFVEFAAGMKIEKKAARKGINLRPGVCFSPMDGTVCLRVPEVEVRLPRELGPESFLLYRITADDLEPSEFFVPVERYLPGAVELGEWRLVLDRPYGRLLVELVEGESGETLYRRELGFCREEDGCSREGHEGPSYIVFGEEDQSGYCAYCRDTIRNSTCWLLKRRALRFEKEPQVIEEVGVEGTGWRDYHAQRLKLDDLDRVILVGERKNERMVIPVRLELGERIKIRESGLLREVTWAGRPVYNRPPILELPVLAEIHGYSLELEDGEGRPLGEYPLEGLVEKKKDHLQLDLAKLPPVEGRSAAALRVILTGKLGERAELELAYAKGLSVRFAADGFYPDKNGQAHPLPVAIRTGELVEPVIDAELKAVSSEASDGSRYLVPPDLFSFTIAHRVDGKEARLRVRVPRFVYVIEDGKKGDGSATYRFTITETHLEDLSPDAAISVFLPLPAHESTVYLEGGSVLESVKRTSDNLRIKLGKFLGAMENDLSNRFRIWIKVKHGDGQLVEFPFLVVRKGWAVSNLAKEIRGGKLKLSWLEGRVRDCEGEVILANLNRPWEEPVSVRVPVEETRCVIDFPGGVARGGCYALCFRLVDEWEIQTPRLPFQLPVRPLARFEIEGNPSIVGHGYRDIYHGLEKATSSLRSGSSDPLRKVEEMVLTELRDDFSLDELRAVLVTFLYWATELGWRHREAEDRICEFLKSWSRHPGRKRELESLLGELKGLGGISVAREVDRLRQRLDPEAIEIPFQNGDLLRHDRDGRLFEFLGVAEYTRRGRTEPYLKLKEIKTETSKKARKKKSSSCGDYYCYFPLDKYMEFHRVEG